jgi:hypothetical protein
MIERRTPAIAWVVAGTAAIVAGVVLLLAPVSGPADAGVIAVAGPTASPAGTTGRDGAPVAAPAGSAPADGIPADGVPADGAPAGTAAEAGRAEPPVADTGTAPPTGVSVPAIGVHAVVLDAPVTRTGELAVPEDPRKIGWWVGGAAAGASAGTVVLAGHVDDRTHDGALFRLGELPMGATVTLSSDTGPYTYRVVARRTYRKQHLPADLFRRDGPPRLALITCGGPFHDGHYDNNVVVYAEPV